MYVSIRTIEECDFEKAAVDSTSWVEVEVAFELEVAKREQSTHSLSPWRRHDLVVTEVEDAARSRPTLHTGTNIYLHHTISCAGPYRSDRVALLG